MSRSNNKFPQKKEEPKKAKPPLIRQNAFLYSNKEYFKKEPNFEFQKSNDPYDYANILQHVGLSQDKTYTIVTMGKYLHFHKKNIERSEKNEPDNIVNRMMQFRSKKIESDSVGWKLHISVKSTDIEKAWSSISSILLKHDLTGFKIIHPDIIKKSFIEGNLQNINNRQFTIYHNNNKNITEDKWIEIVTEIDEALHRNNIAPALEYPIANKKISGSDYFSYRNDTHPSNPSTYISQEDAVAFENTSKNKTLQIFNLIEAIDPYENVKISPKNSLNL